MSARAKPKSESALTLPLARTFVFRSYTTNVPKTLMKVRSEIFALVEAIST